MPRKDFFAFIKASLPKELQEKYLSENIKSALLKETDESETLNEAQLILNKFSSTEFNLVDYNIQIVQETMQLCINQRRELKDLEVMIANQSAQRVITALRRKSEKMLREKTEELLSDSYKILTRQTKLLIENSIVLAEEKSEKNIQEYDAEVKPIIEEYRIATENIEDQLLELALEESYGLNYLARYQQLKSVYKARILDLYKYLKNLYLGVLLIYDKNYEKPPNPRPNYFLYDCNNWLQELISYINKKQSCTFSQLKIIDLKRTFPKEYKKLIAGEHADFSQLLHWGPEYFESISMVIIDNGTDTKNDTWPVWINLNANALFTDEKILTILDDNVNLAQWSDMIKATRKLFFLLQATNSAANSSFSQISFLNLKSIPCKMLIIDSLSIGESHIYKKNLGNIDNIFLYLKGSEVKDSDFIWPHGGNS